VQLISYFGAWFTNVAIYTLLVTFDVSAFTISLVAAVHFLPSVIQSPFIGPLIDKFDSKKLMLILLFIELISTIMLLFVDSIEMLWLLFILLYIKMSASSFYFTCEMSLLPKILKGESLKLANEVHSIIWSLSYSLGMAISGLFVYYFGIYTSITFDALLFLLSIYILVSINIKDDSREIEIKFFAMIVDGIKYLNKNRDILSLMLLHSCVGLTAFDTLITLLADTKYKEVIAVSLAIGFINASRAIALIIGPIILSRFVNRYNFFFILLAQSIVIILWAFLQYNFYLSLIGSFFIGFFTTIIWSFTYTLLQERIDSKYYGRVISYNDMMFMSVGVLTSISIGLLADLKVALEIITILIGIAFFLFALYYKSLKV
jgi:MFS family permease